MTPAFESLLARISTQAQALSAADNTNPIGFVSEFEQYAMQLPNTPQLVAFLEHVLVPVHADCRRAVVLQVRKTYETMLRDLERAAEYTTARAAEYKVFGYVTYRALLLLVTVQHYVTSREGAEAIYAYYKSLLQLGMRKLSTLSDKTKHRLASAHHFCVKVHKQLSADTPLSPEIRASLAAEADQVQDALSVYLRKSF